MDLRFIGADSFARETFVDANGIIWKYTEPGAMPRERHDRLYTASGNDSDGEPESPMPEGISYQVIND